MPVYFYDVHEKPYGCFCNFSQDGFELDGDWWKTSEHYFQAQKFIATSHFDEVRKLEKPRETFDLAHKLHHLVRKDWLQVRDDVVNNSALKGLSL
jgi:N-glycosidase YbiA